MIRPSSHWRRRALLFLVSQCITLFGSPLVQMSIVWYVTLETSSGAWVAAFAARSCPLPWPGSTPESGTTYRDTAGSRNKVLHRQNADAAQYDLHCDSSFVFLRSE